MHSILNGYPFLCNDILVVVPCNKYQITGSAMFIYLYLDKYSSSSNILVVNTKILDYKTCCVIMALHNISSNTYH